MTAPLQEADMFFVPLLDGRFGLGQVDAVDGDGVTVFLSMQIANPEEVAPALSKDDVVARLRVAPEPFSTGQWPRNGYTAIPRLRAWSPEHAPQEPAVIEAFVNALHGLVPWNSFGRPDFFDTLLFNGTHSAIKRA